MRLRFVSAFAILLLQFGCRSGAQERNNEFLGVRTIRLWNEAAPGAVGNSEADIPTLTVLSPWAPKPNHPAIIVAPGGSYKMLASIHEGREVADWFAARGFTAFVLKYRLGPRYLYPVPLEDAQRAVRLVRSRAKEFGVDPNRIGMIGFSAGGHLTAMTANSGDAHPANGDPVDQQSDRLSFTVLVYPWLNAMEAQQKPWISYCSELKIPDEKCKTFAQFAPAKRVSAQTPPAFLFHTADDNTVPVRASMEYFQALHSAGVPAELHVYEKGPHGVGLASDRPFLDTWTTLLDHWLREQGLLQ